MCVGHLVLPPGANVDGAIFACIACHMQASGTRSTPYYVWSRDLFIVALNYLLLVFGQGFYRGAPATLQGPFNSWVPALEHPLKFQGIHQMTAKSQVLSSPILILNLILSSIDPVASPSRIVSEIMKQFVGDAVQYHEIIFDLGSKKLVDEHSRAMARFVRQLKR